MRHYKISIAEIRQLTSYDQALMIEALIDKPSVGGQIHFDTEEEYLAWKRKR